MPDIEEHIRKALEEGKFADLPGKGKPLRLEDDPHADPEWRLAYHVLKESGFSLPWIEKRQEIEAEIAEARQALQRAWDYRAACLAENQPYAQVEAGWQQALGAFREKAEKINQRIGDYNLGTPNERFQRGKLKVEQEVDRVRGRV